MSQVIGLSPQMSTWSRVVIHTYEVPGRGRLPNLLGSWDLYFTVSSLVNYKMTCIAYCPMIELIQFDPLSSMLAGEILFDCREASEMYEGLVYADVLLGHIHICKFFSEVVYEGPNFVESPRG